MCPARAATTAATAAYMLATTSETRSFMDRTMILSAPMPPGSVVRSYCGLPSVFVTPITATGVRTEASTTLPASGVRASDRRASSVEAASPREVDVERWTSPEEVWLASAGMLTLSIGTGTRVVPLGAKLKSTIGEVFLASCVDRSAADDVSVADRLEEHKSE